MFRPILTTPPAELPVDVDLCKQHSVVDYDDDDQLIEGYIHAACGILDGFSGRLGRCIINQTWQVQRVRFERVFHLPVPDVSTVEISCTLTTDEAFTVPAASVLVEPVATGTNIRFKRDFSFPALAADTSVSVRFTAGFGGAADVPWPLKVAIMQIVAHLHDDRDGRGDPPMTLTDPFRWSRV